MKVEPIDRMAQGDPETVVCLPGSTLVGLLIRGIDAPMMLGIREDELGRPEACAITTELLIDTSRVRVNPRHATGE